MKSCAQAQGLFGAYWDDESTLAEREWLDQHFVTCTACRSSYEQFSSTLELVSTLPRHETAPGFTDRVLAAARQSRPAHDSIRFDPTPAARWVPMASAVGAAAVLLVIAVSILPNLRGQRAAGPIAQREPSASTAGPLATGAMAPIVQPRLTVAQVAVAVVTDSLFDHSSDVEFMLEPVQLRRGRAHTGSSLPDGFQAEQVVITF